MATEIQTPRPPPDWVNRLIGLALRTPLLRRVVGRTFALLAVTGAKTGRRYEVAIQYLTRDGEFVVGSLRTRRWWRNVSTRPDVEILIAGTWVKGRARIPSGDEARSLVRELLVTEPKVARFYGLHADDSGTFPPDDVDRLLEQVVYILVTPSPAAAVPETAGTTTGGA